MSGCHSLHALKIEEIWGGIANIFEEICQNLTQNLRRIEEISHMYVLVYLTFTDVMSSNITVYSRRNTTLTIGKKWTFNMKLCNLYYIILTIWTHIMCMNKHFITLISVSVQDYRINNTLQQESNLFTLFYDPVPASIPRKRYYFPAFFLKQMSNFSPNGTTVNKKRWDIYAICRN